MTRLSGAGLGSELSRLINRFRAGSRYFSTQLQRTPATVATGLIKYRCADEVAPFGTGVTEVDDFIRAVE